MLSMKFRRQDWGISHAQMEIFFAEPIPEQHRRHLLIIFYSCTQQTLKILDRLMIDISPMLGTLLQKGAVAKRK